MGGGGRGAGAARPGGTVTPSLTAGPRASRLGGGEAGPSAPAAPVLGARGSRGGGRLLARGRPSLAWRAWKVSGHRRLHAPGLLGRVEFSLVANSCSQGDIKLGNDWTSHAM